MKRQSKKVLAFLMSAAMLTSAVVPAMAAGAGNTTFDTLSDLDISSVDVAADGVATKGLLFSKADAMLDAALAKAKASASEFVVITGDLTRDGTLASHQKVAAKLAAFEADANKQVYVIPGENDVAKSSVNANAIDDATFKSIYNDFGYSEATATSGLNYSVVKDGVRLILMDSVATSTADKPGQGAIDATWATAQTAAAVTAGETPIGFSHHPSISRGGVDYILAGLLYTVGDIRDADGNKMFTGDPLEGVTVLNDASAFGMDDMKALCDAGMDTIFTGHSMMMCYAAGAATGTNTWTDYCTGSLVTNGAGIRTNTVAAGVVTSTTNYIETLNGANVYDLALAAMKAYMPTAVEETFAKAKPVLVRAINILQPIAGKMIDGLDLSGSVPSFLQGYIKGSIKDLINDVIGVVKNTTNLYAALDEIKVAFMNTKVPTSATAEADMTTVLSDVVVTLHHDNTAVSPSLQAISAGLKAETPDKTLAVKAVQNFAAELNKDGDSLISLMNNVLNQNLSILLQKHTLRELLNGPVSYLGNTVDLWGILDSTITTNPDGTPIPPEYKPSALYRPLVNAIFLMDTNPGSSALTLARFTTGVSNNADALIQIALDGGLASVI